MIFGFYFDIVSFMNGYYSYPDIFYVYLLGVPLTMTIAEGFAVAITIKMVSMLIGRKTKKKKPSKKK